MIVGSVFIVFKNDTTDKYINIANMIEYFYLEMCPCDC